MGHFHGDMMLIWDILTSRGRRRRLHGQPAQLQTACLKRMLSAASRTEFGRRHRFHDVLQARDLQEAYRQQVPLQSYCDFEADIERMKRGAVDVLWPGAVSWFAVSGGTTAGKKLIPMSPARMQSNARYQLDMAGSYMDRPGQSAVFLKPWLGLSGNLSPDPAFPQCVIGEMSALMAERAWRSVPRWRRSRAARTIGSTAERLEANLERKMDLAIARTLPLDVHWMVFAPSWGVMLLRRVLEAASREWGREVRTVSDVWPNLKLITTGARPLATYRSGIEELIGNPRVDFLEMYGASEATYAYQDDLTNPAMLLHTDSGVYYEFVPLSEYGNPSPMRLSIGEVQAGEDYVLYVSNSSGLWSYDTGDIVCFVSLVPPRLLVKGRAIEMLDSVGEYLPGTRIQQALQKVCQRHSAQIHEIHVSVQPASATERHHHQWLVEWAQPPVDFTRFLRDLDDQLCQDCDTYRSVRHLSRLGEPELICVPSGTFYQMLTNRGPISVQTKVRLASEDRQTFEQLYAAAVNRSQAGQPGLQVVSRQMRAS